MLVFEILRHFLSDLNNLGQFSTAKTMRISHIFNKNKETTGNVISHKSPLNNLNPFSGSKVTTIVFIVNLKLLLFYKIRYPS